MQSLLVISAAFPPLRSGESEHVLYLCRHLSAAGLDVHVLTGEGSAASANESFTVHPIMRDWKSRDIPRLVHALRRLRPEFVLLIYSDWTYHFHPMVTFVPTLVHRLLGKRCITQFEAMYRKHSQDSLGGRIFSVVGRRWAGAGADWFYGTLLRDSDCIIVLSNRYRDDLAQTQPGIEKKSVLLPPPPLLHVVPEGEGLKSRLQKRAEWGVQDSDFVVAFFGYMYPGKGVDILLRTATLVPNMRVVLIGGELVGEDLPKHASYAQEMQSLAKELGILDRVVWTGQYASDSDEPSRCLWAVDACALPFDDGITVNRSSFAAAAAHDLPIITTRGAAIDSMFVEEENVLLCPPHDAEALSLKIQDLMTSPELRARLQKGIRRLSQDWFSWERVVSHTLSSLEICRPREGA